MPQRNLPNPELLSRVIDVHCHPTDTPPSDEAMQALKIKICAMASRRDDQAKVKALAEKWPDKVTPCFGWHPWHTHTISLVDPPLPKAEHYTKVLLAENSTSQSNEVLDQLMPNLPEPIPLQTILDELSSNLTDFPNAMVGEVGIDRAFRIPFVPYPAPPPRKLSPFTVPIDHQLAVLEAQLALAIKFKRPVSFHSVKGQQITLDLLKRLKKTYESKFGDISIDLHSCGFSAESWREVERLYPNVFLSLSVAINGKSPGHQDLIRTCSPTRILAESDYNDIAFSTEGTWAMVCTIAELKGWTVEQGTWDDGDDTSETEWGVVRRLDANFRTFIRGGLGLAAPKETHKARQLKKLDDWETDEEASTEAA